MCDAPAQRSPSACAHCGSKRLELRRCLRCKAVAYCGKECQAAAWKGHKATCEPIDALRARVRAARTPTQYSAIMQRYHMLDMLLEGQSAAASLDILTAFSHAHQWRMAAFAREVTTDEDVAIVCNIEEQRQPLLGEIGRPREQGESMAFLGVLLAGHGDSPTARSWFKATREVGSQCGDFWLEFRAACGLGCVAAREEEFEEAVPILLHAAAVCTRALARRAARAPHVYGATCPRAAPRTT